MSETHKQCTERQLLIVAAEAEHVKLEKQGEEIDGEEQDLDQRIQQINSEIDLIKHQIDTEVGERIKLQEEKMNLNLEAREMMRESMMLKQRADDHEKYVLDTKQRRVIENLQNDFLSQIDSYKEKNQKFIKINAPLQVEVQALEEQLSQLLQNQATADELQI